MPRTISLPSATASRQRKRLRLTRGGDATFITRFQLQLCRSASAREREHRTIQLWGPWVERAERALAGRPSLYPIIWHLGQLPAFLEADGIDDDPVRGDTAFSLRSSELVWGVLTQQHVRRALRVLHAKKLIYVTRADDGSTPQIRIRCSPQALRRFALREDRDRKKEAPRHLRLANDAHAGLRE